MELQTISVIQLQTSDSTNAFNQTCVQKRPCNWVSARLACRADDPYAESIPLSGCRAQANSQAVATPPRPLREARATLLPQLLRWLEVFVSSKDAWYASHSSREACHRNTMQKPAASRGETRPLCKQFWSCSRSPMLPRTSFLKRYGSCKF